MRFRCAVGVAACVAVAACEGPSKTPPAPSPEPSADALSVEASLSDEWKGGVTSVRLDADGVAAVAERGRGKPERRLDCDFRLNADEAADLRLRISESRFFGDWADQGPVPHAGMIDVVITLGALTRSRRFCDAQPEFEPVAQFLRRIVAQAATTDRLRRGEIFDVTQELESKSPRVLRPSALVPEFLRCARATKDADKAGAAAAVLMRVLPPAEFAAFVDGWLPGLDDVAREAALGAWVSRFDGPGYAPRDAALVPYRAIVAPLALEHVRRIKADWTSMTRKRQGVVRTLFARSSRERPDEALAIAEEMIRALSTPDHAFGLDGVAETGAPAAALCLRLIDDEQEGVRLSALLLADELIKVAKATGGGVVLSKEETAALLDRLSADVVPALERRSRAPDESVNVRTACFEALDRWNGRDRRAEERARRAEAAKKREAAAAADRDADAARRAKAEQSRPPKGALSIAGRLVGVGDTPLAGFTVIAFRDDGPPDDPFRGHGSSKTAADGSFRIDGLVDADFTLIAMPVARWGPRDLAANASARDGVRAGSSDVVVRFPGSMLRGRVVDEAGRPVARQALRAQMRNAPNRFDGSGVLASAYAETAADGRFWMLQLLPGVYDIAVPAHPLVDGAAGVVAGPDEITIVVRAGASITGRVLDERGVVLLGCGAGAAPVGSPNALVCGRVDEFGRFTIDGLDPTRSYDVVASFRDRGRDLNATRDARVSAVMPGAGDLLLLIDTGPRVELRVDFGQRAPRSGAVVRLTRVYAGATDQREFAGASVDWRMAPQATWRVSAKVRDVDARGDAVDVWIELGTVETGGPEKTFVVPR